jgi:hypothetical protein
MEALPGDLLARLRERAGSPTRNDADHGVPVGTYDDWFEAVAVMEAAVPGSATAFALGAENARANGWPMQPLHVFRHADGSLSASTTPAPTTVPAAAGPEAWALVEAATGQRVPGDLRDLYGVADGGFGPGIGGGLNPLARVVAEYEDLCRRGPGYTGEAPWPVSYLPICDITGPVSYDLATGAIVAFNDYWYDDDVAIEDAFTQIAPDLTAWLREWLAG